MPALPQLYPYKAGAIEPIVLPREIVGIYVAKTYYFYRILYIEGIPYSDPIQHDFGAIAAGVSSAITQMNLLEMPDKEFGQFRGRVLDDFACDLYQGRGVRRFPTKNRVARYDLFTNLIDPDGHNGEFFVHEDDFLFCQANNLTDYNLAQTRVAFWGFRYILEDITDEQGKPKYSWKDGILPEQWTPVPASGRE